MAKKPKDIADAAPDPGDDSPSVPDIFKSLGLPPEKINGENNPEFYRQAYGAIFKMTMAHVGAGDRVPFNAESVVMMIDRMAKAAGFDPAVLRDRRTKEQVAAESIKMLVDNPSSIWELTDSEIDAVESAMDAADKLCLDRIEVQRRESGMTDTEEPEFSVPKSWRSRLERVRRLRNRAMNPVPKWKFDGKQISNGDPLRPFFAAGWILRMMVYCGRSNMTDRTNGDPSKAVYSVAAHHAKMAVAVWDARAKVRYGIPYDKSSSLPQVLIGEHTYKGCVLVCAPGHGKSELGRFVAASFFVENPMTQAKLCHAQAKEAEKNLGYLASLFSKDNPAGRRFTSLFPNLITIEKNASRFNIKTKEQLRDHSGFAGSVRSKVSGASASFMWFDDPVDQKEVTQETTRKETFNLLNGTWLTRLRGQQTFLLITATLWHESDAVSEYIKLVKSEKVSYRVSMQACGGPKSHPEFASIWPEVYPSSELRQIYNRMKNPGLYSAAYMANPTAEESRIIQVLRLYDPASEEHTRFLSSATKYLSLDPAATRGERSDRAGVLYAGMGQIVVTKEEDGRRINHAESRLRLIESDSIPATQADLVMHVVNLCKYRKVDYVIVETRSGFHATADMFENYHGIDVIRMDPKNRNKEERLRAAAPAIEDKNANVGLRAVVEFPGIPVVDKYGQVVRDGNGNVVLRIDPKFHDISLEILNFGTCATDHSVDCLSQMVIYLTAELGIGSGGIVTQKVLQTIREGVDPRLLSVLDRHEKGPPKLPAGQDLEQWTKDAWSMPKIENNSPMGFQL